MNILYGVCGEGFGHSSRAKEIIKHLMSKEHKVLIITYGQAYDVLKKFNVIKVEGVTLIFDKNKLSLKKTIKHNINLLVKNVKNWKKIKKKIDNFSPDLCISDMEPLVPIVSNWYKLPLISIDNQHRLTHMRIKIQRKYLKDYLIAKAVVNRCISKADLFIILSFIKSKSRNSSIVVNPILREEIIKLKPKNKNKILVYQTKTNKKLISILKTIQENFVVYGYNKNKKEKNITLKKFSRNFIIDLAECKAIIASAGFTLISEALYLKKPYFAIPLQGQFEQTLNSLFLKKSGLGTFSENPSKKEILSFIKNLKVYKKRLKKYKSNPKEAFRVVEKAVNARPYYQH